MTKQRRTTPLNDPVSGGAADEPADCPTQDCPHRCPEMEIQVNDTPDADDDQVQLHTEAERPTTPCRIRATNQAAGAQAILSNPDGRLRFPGASQVTRTLALPDDGSWTGFSISGETASASAGDAVIEARCNREGQPLKASATVTVCALAIASETEQTVPNDRTRTRLGVEEDVTLTATGAIRNVTWEVVEGDGTLSATTGAQVTYRAHHLEQTARIQATDGAGCKAVMVFDVDCNYVLARARMAEIFSGAPEDRVNALTDAFNEFYDAFDIDDCLRRAHFFAQVLEEVGVGANPRRESLNYTPQALRNTFRYYRDRPDESEAHGRTAAHPADQQAIANNAYANRLGNGNAASGDGWAFRGGGYLQLTGRANYAAIQQEMDARSPGSGIDIVADPNAAVRIRGGMISAMAFWSRNNINNAADGGSADASINAVTTIINRWTHSYAERRANFRNRSGPAFHVADCPRVTE